MTNPQIVSRWPVQLECAVGPHDCDDGGLLRGDAIERLFGTVRSAYFKQCSSLQEGIAVIQAAFQAGAPATGESGVIVTVAVVEIFGDGFTMQARIRGQTGREVLATASCTCRVEVTTEMRDEFISLAHAATYLG